MVRGRKKSSTDNDAEVVATPSRRSGRARKAVAYGEEDEIPQALRECKVIPLFFTTIYRIEKLFTQNSFWNLQD